ncbi:hypothetical protein IC614_12125 [Allosphingosinicella flava]|uniref:Uncharacterized protein n=1 Tax=Allosphingosinicella flava TaxID=2771430 RepID=A0A7T2LM54_9SPHN|nr:hypothetical protein [Sphingosinicella flava]QPQ55028.1 hypothetical protein IC614_12125 [Sphingosinicella flava]
MKSVLLAAVLATGAVAAPRSTPDQQLAHILKDRVAGKPQHCIDTSRILSSRIIDDTAIVYDAGHTLYVNRPASAEGMNDWDIMVTRTFGSRLCDNDVVTLVDPGSRMMSGLVFLGEFVPYKKVKAKG